MPTYAGTAITPEVGGTSYADATPLTTTEADLNNVTSNPISIPWGQAVQAVVKFTVTGFPAGNSTYVVMQTDMGDGNWIDVAWCMHTGTQGSATFVLSGGVAGNNAFQQTRQANSPPNPQANGSNAMVLGGRIRFVGRSQFTGGSSYVAGAFVGVLCTIKFHVLPLR